MPLQRFLAGLLAALPLASSAVVAQEIKNASSRLPDGTRILRHEGVVAAPRWRTTA